MWSWDVGLLGSAFMRHSFEHSATISSWVHLHHHDVLLLVAHASCQWDTLQALEQPAVQGQPVTLWVTSFQQQNHFLSTRNELVFSSGESHWTHKPSPALPPHHTQERRVNWRSSSKSDKSCLTKLFFPTSLCSISQTMPKLGQVLGFYTKGNETICRLWILGRIWSCNLHVALIAIEAEEIEITSKEKCQPLMSTSSEK